MHAHISMRIFSSSSGRHIHSSKKSADRFHLKTSQFPSGLESVCCSGRCHNVKENSQIFGSGWPHGPWGLGKKTFNYFDKKFGDGIHHSLGSLQRRSVLEKSFPWMNPQKTGKMNSVQNWGGAELEHGMQQIWHPNQRAYYIHYIHWCIFIIQQVICLQQGKYFQSINILSTW